MILLMTGVLLVKVPAYNNHRLVSYHDNGFCDMIITLSILLNITTCTRCTYTTHSSACARIHISDKVRVPVVQVLCITLPMQADSLLQVTNHQPIRVGTLDFLYRQLRETQTSAICDTCSGCTL